MAHTYSPGTQERQRQEDHAFEAILDYIVNLRLTWAIRSQLDSKKKRKEKYVDPDNILSS